MLRNTMINHNSSVMGNRSRCLTYGLFLLLLCSATLLLNGCKHKPDPIVITPDIEKNHLQRNHIYGNVKFIYTDTYYLMDDSLKLSDTTKLKTLLADRTPVLRSAQQYTSDGYLLSFLRFSPQGDTLLKQKYYYNDLAKATRWEEFDSTNTLITHGEYLYDNNHYLKGEKIFQNDSLVISFNYITDGIGNIIKSTQNNGNFSSVTESSYNESGLVQKIVEYEPDGKVFKTVKIEYDNYGDEVNRCVYKAGNQMIEYTYNEYSQEGKQIKTIYEDKIHHKKEVRQYRDYDQHNNWQTEIKIKDNKIISIRKRQIIYY